MRTIRSAIALFLFAASLTVYAHPEKSSCTAKELARQDCRLQAGSYELRLLSSTIAWTDGTWHTVDPMPLGGKTSAWEKVEFTFLGHWPVLQLWLWEKGNGESQIQDLHWYVTDAEKRKLTILSEGIVRRRHLEPVAMVEAPLATAKPGKKTMPAVTLPPPKFLFDPMEVHSLKALKNGNLEWHLGGQKKVLERAQLQTNE